MKRINHLIVAILCMVFAANSASAITEAERQAQQAVRTYLKEKKVNTKIDDRDNSVNFQYKDKLFWITFKEVKQNCIEYTLHRAHAKLGSNTAREKAYFATNYLNSKYNYKAFVNGNRVEFVSQTYAATPQEYTGVLLTLLKNMENIGKEFEDNYRRATFATDSIHSYWNNIDTTAIVIDQLNAQQVSATHNLTASKVDFRIVDANGNPITQYGESIRKADLKFIQPQITVKATKKGMYHISVIITTPDGKTLLPSRKALRTITSTVEVDKKDRAIDLGTFGNTSGDFWKAGEYKVTFFEDDTPIKTTTFNVL